MFKRIFALLLLSIMLLTPVIAFADDSGLVDALMQQNTSSNADIVKDLGTENINLAEAKSKLQRVSDVVGKIISFGLVIIWLIVLVFVIPDMLYILIPPLRKYLYPAYGNGSSPSNMMTTGGYTSPFGQGIGGYGGYGSGFGRHMFGSGISNNTQYRSDRQWISDAARDAMEEAFNSVTPAMTASMGFQQAPSSAKPKRKMVLVAYFKRKTVELVLCTAIPLILISGLPYLVGGLLAELIVNFSMKGVNSLPQVFNFIQ